jgi:general secretion pathway protein G
MQLTLKLARTAQRRSLNRGMTLIELLVVLVILTLVAGLIGPTVLNQLGGAKTKTAGLQVKAIEQALDVFKLDVGRYPSSAEGLRSLIERPGSANGWSGPYMRELPNDPWNAPYQYKFPGRNGAPDVFTYGADGKVGGEGEDADVFN